MYEQVEKTKENKSRAVANSVAQKKSNVKQYFRFVDNRAELIVQRKINETTQLQRSADNHVTQQQSIQKKENISPHDNLQISSINCDGSNRNTSSQIIQRVPFKLAEHRFNDLILEERRISSILEEGNDLESEYWKNENENDFKKFWRKYTIIEFPEKFESALEIWQEVVEAPLDNLFDDLKTITQLPGELSKDTINLNIGQRLDNLKNILEQKNLSFTGEGFKNYIIEQMIHFSGIRQRLLSNPDVLGELWGGDPKKMQIVFESLGADEHGYAPPTKLGISDGKEHKSLVYKSRIGEVDKLVTDLFQAINDLQLAGGKLPAYKQAIFRDKHLLAEFIQGHAVDSKISLMSGAGNALDTLGRLVPDPELLEKNILLLEAVAKQIGLTDLHEENLILNPNTNQVVPIDLEAFSFGKKQETGLYGHKKAPDVEGRVPQEALPLITEFGDRLEKIERRFVPVPTGVLYNSLNQQDGVKTVVSLIKESFINNGLQVNDSALEKYVNNCKANHPMAIPAFTLKEGIVLSSALGRDSQLEVAKRNKV